MPSSDESVLLSTSFTRDGESHPSLAPFTSFSVPRRAQNQLVVDKQLYLSPVMGCHPPGWALSAGLIELEHEAPLRPRLVRAEQSSPARLRQWTLDADPTPPPLAW